MTSKGRPESDASNAGWVPSTGADLYAVLDEAAPEGSDYISASAVGLVCELALGATTEAGAVQRLKFRASSATGNSVIVRLKQAGTTIRSMAQVLTPTDTEYSLTLTVGEIAAVAAGSLTVELESA